MSSVSAIQAGLFAAVVTASVSARAADIRWTGDVACRRELEVAEQVTSMIGREVSTIDGVDFELVARLAKDDSWQLELKTVSRADGSQSSRSLEGKTCVDVTDAAAVAIALAIGQKPDASDAPGRVKSSSSVVAPAPAPTESRAKLVARHAPNVSSLQWFVAASGALDSSVTPKVALGGALRLGLSFLPTSASSARLRFELEGTLYAPTETATSNGRGGKFQLGYLAPLVCAERPLAANAVLGCIGYEIGQLSGEGSGAAVTTSHRKGTLWSAARAELGLFVPLGANVRAFARGGAALALIRRREFALDGSDVVFRPSALSARGQLGVELSF